LICALRLELELPYAVDLKHKRQTIRSLRDRLRKKNVSVVESENQDLWQRATLELAMAAVDHAGAEQRREEVRRIVLNYEDLAIVAWREEFIKL